MSARQKPGSEILLEQLEKRVAELTQEKKALESAIKETNSQLYEAELDSVSTIADVKARTEQECSTLRESVKPLKDLQAACLLLRSEIDKLKQSKSDVVTEVKQAKSGAIRDADIRMAKAATRLANIEAAIAKCKEAVAAL